LTREDGRSSGDGAGAPSSLGDIAFLCLAVAVVVLPAWLRSVPTGPVVVRDAGAAPVRIDVNRAPWYEWMLLQGIGEVRARRLVEYRESHGPFRSPEDLKRVPQMPEGWVEKAIGHLTFGD